MAQRLDGPPSRNRVIAAWSKVAVKRGALAIVLKVVVWVPWVTLCATARTRHSRGVLLVSRRHVKGCPTSFRRCFWLGQCRMSARTSSEGQVFGIKNPTFREQRLDRWMVYVSTVQRWSLHNSFHHMISSWYCKSPLTSNTCVPAWCVH